MSYAPTSPAPEAQSLDPDHFPAGSRGLLVNIRGASFAPGAIAQFTSHVTNLATDFVSPALLVAHVDVESGVTGPGDVIVTNPDGQQATLRGAYAIEAVSLTAPAPRAARPKAKKKAAKAAPTVAKKASPTAAKKASSSAAKKAPKKATVKNAAKKASPTAAKAKKSPKKATVKNAAKAAPAKKAPEKRPGAKKASPSKKEAPRRAVKQ
jgi:hypothetical protein